MSWAVEEWKDGLPGKALQKIQEMESQLDKLKKERQQKQFQMDSLEATLQKQRQKMDSEKSEAASLKRENQSLVESCESLDKTKQKLAHDLQVKEQQVNYLEGQLNSSKKQIDRLEQDVKRYKSEFERSQTSHAAEIPQFNTPQKTFATPATPNHWQQDSRIGDLQEKYNREVEERKRLEAEIKVMHVKLLNQSSMSHKDIARQQSGSSIFPWQQEQTHSHQSLTMMETPSRRRNGPSWSYDDTPIKPLQQFTSGTQNDTAGSQQMEQIKNINQDLRAKVSELELRLQAQEKDVKNQINKFSEIQSQLEMARKDLAEKDKLLSKSRDELTKATGQYEQSVSKCSSVEQKLKQVTEEMNCQRHNSEMMHRSLEQKIKDQERESQKELAQLQSSHQTLDQQFNQVKNKMSMEIQQAKKDNNVLQSEMDKVTALKNRLEKDLDELKQKHLRSEQALQATQTKETEIKKKFDEMQKEKNTLSCQLEQGLKRVKQLEEEKQNIEQNLAKNRTMVDDLKVKTQTQSEELTEIRKKMDRQSVSSAQELEHAKKNLAEIEMKNMKTQAEFQKFVNEIEMKANKICALEKENENLKMTTNSCQKEVAETKKEYETLLEWKTEKEQLISNAESNREEMLSKIADLERDLATLNGAHDSLANKLQDSENDKLCISGQIDALKGELLNKCVEMEEKGRAYEELQHQFSETDQKHTKEMENLKRQISQMHGQVSELEAKLHQEINKVKEMEQAHGQLLAEYESACDLAKSKDSIIEMNRTEITHLQESISSREQEFEKCRDEKCTLAKEYEDSLARNKELEEAKWSIEQCQQEVLDKIASLESDLATQKSSNTDIQGKYDDLSKLNEDLVEKVFLAEKREKELVNEVEALLQKCKSFSSLEEQFNTLVAEEENTRNALEKINELQVQTASELASQKTIAETLANHVEEEQRKASILEEDNTQLKVKLQKFENEAKDVSEKYDSLQKLHSVVCQEKENHLNQVSMLSEALAEKDALIENFAEIRTELETSNQLCITLKNSLQSLQKLYDSSIELNVSLEKTLQDRSEEQALLETRLKELTERHSRETEGFVSEMEAHVKKQKGLEEHFNILGAELESKRMEVRNASEKLEVVALEKAKLMEDLGLSNEKLNEVTESYQKVSKELENVQLNVLPNMPEIENLKAALTVLKSQEEAKSSEIKTLKEKLQEAQSEQAKGLEALKEKNINISKIEVQLEMLQMDLEDNETCLNAFDAQVEELRGNISVLEANLGESEAQKSTLQTELKSVKEDYKKSILEVSQLSACLEETQKEQQCSSALVAEIESLQVTNEKLKVSLEQETCKQANLEAMYNNLVEQKNKLESAFKELKADAQNTQGKMDSLKQRNECLVCEIAQLQSHIEQLQSERTLAVNSDPDKEPTAYENDPDVSQDICEMPFANTSILPFEEDAALVRISSIDDEQPASQKEATDLSTVEEGQHLQLEKQNKTTDLEEVSHVLEETVRTMEEQMGVKIEQVKLQHAEEIKKMEEQMLMIKNELEAKLRDKQQHTEILSSQLEATMQQLQELDLASSSLLAPETSEGVKTNKSDEQDNIQNPDQSDSSEKTLVELTTIKETLEKREEELLHLQSQFELLTSEMTIRRDLCSELEGKVCEMEVEKENCTVKVTSITQANQKLNDYIVELTNEIDSLTLQLQTSKCQLSDVMEMMESLQVAKGEWNEKYFQTESELKRVRSEKANLEKHILSMEADIEEMQDQKQKLAVELEASRRTNCSLEQQLRASVEEGGQLKEELVLWAEERESELHSLLKWKEKAELLENRDADARELIKVLEDDIRAGKRQIEVTSEQINVLLKEKEQVMQQSEHIENTMTLLKEENTNLLSELNNLKNSDNCASRESENLSSKIHSLENENVRVSQSLESSLLEKGEIASRLISTQEEVAQMRRGIEKLKVRIESDERKKNHMSQLLKDAQRKADALQDNIEQLEREKDISEQNLEDAFLQAETTKAELEELQAEQQELTKKIEEMTNELRDLKEDKCKLEQELQRKNTLIEESELSNREASEKLKSIEQAMEEATVSQQQAIQDFQYKVGAMEEELLCCRNELESSDRKVQDLAYQLLSLQSENSQFAQRVLEYEKCQTELHSSNQLLMKDLEIRQEEFSKEKAQLQSQVTELQALSLVREERDQLQNEKVILQSTIAQLEKNAQMQSARIEDTQTSVTSLENQLNAMQLMNSELTQKLNALNKSSLQLQMQHQRQLCEANEKQNALENNQNLLTCQLQEAQQQAEAYKVSLEALTLKKHGLEKQLSEIQETHDVQVLENNRRYEENLKQVQQQNEMDVSALKEKMTAVEEKSAQYLSELNSCRSQDADVVSALKELQIKLETCEKDKAELDSKFVSLSKEKDSAMSKISLWMKSCKRLESEKQALQGELEKTLALQPPQRQGDNSSSDALQEELQELREALEEKSRESDESMDRYCSLMVKVHKLEETNESLKNQVKQLTAQAKTSKSRRSLRSEKNGLENSKPVERADSMPAVKRQRADDTPNKAQEALHNITKRLKAAAATPKAVQDDEDFRPEGLPELVLKGFGDIPVGEMSPFIIRRTTEQRCSPRLAARTAATQQSPTSTEPSVQISKRTAEGSTSKTVPEAVQNSAAVLTSVSNSPQAKTCENSVTGAEKMLSRRSRSIRKSPEKRVNVSGQQNDNCQVQ
ncbi:centromere protein F isoform X2 [Triplophysa rosa]|uniref:Centromere protein F n=1 Tax=Triplophysa rosa TaxID=992332 RepID=A0A9W7TXS0_TRIRA|nr:centromere protein F isoform X2 [Triplophysa rosa]KAI7804504.1 putative centromere protein F [Triplophysa rosa]